MILHNPARSDPLWGDHWPGYNKAQRTLSLPSMSLHANTYKTKNKEHELRSSGSCTEDSKIRD